MASESGCRAPSSSVESYIGSSISLISKCDIRYEGILYHLNIEDSTIGLKNVRSYGTEGRKNDGPQILPSDKVYECILFRGSDIKDLQLKGPPLTETDRQIHDDPAVIQLNHAGVLNSQPSALLGHGTLTVSKQCQDTQAFCNEQYPNGLSLCQSIATGNIHSRSLSMQSAGPQSPSTTMQEPKYNGTLLHISKSPKQSTFLPPSSLSFQLKMDNQMWAPEIHSSASMGFSKNLDCADTVSLSTAFAHPNLVSASSSEQHSVSHDFSSPFQSTMMPSFSSFPPVLQEISDSKAQITGQSMLHRVTILFGQSVPSTASSFLGSTSDSLPPSSLSLYQLSQSGADVLSSTKKLCGDPRDLVTPTRLPRNSLESIAPLEHQEPLSSLRVTPALQFTEEFDFQAMNEKFKKDEVWGYLGKAMQRDFSEVVGDNSIGIMLGETESHLAIRSAKPAYNKDEFFDTISCNSLARGSRNGQNRFSRLKTFDSETTRNLKQIGNLGFGGYGVRRGENFWGSNNWERG